MRVFVWSAFAVTCFLWEAACAFCYVCLSVCLCFRPVSAPSMNWRTLESRHSGKFWGQKFTVTRSRIVSMAKVLHTSERKARQNMAGFWSRLKHSEVEGQKWRSRVFIKVGYDELHLMNLASFCRLTWWLYFRVKYIQPFALDEWVSVHQSQ